MHLVERHPRFVESHGSSRPVRTALSPSPEVECHTTSRRESGFSMVAPSGCGKRLEPFSSPTGAIMRPAIAVRPLRHAVEGTGRHASEWVSSWMPQARSPSTLYRRILTKKTLRDVLEMVRGGQFGTLDPRLAGHLRTRPGQETPTSSISSLHGTCRGHSMEHGRT